MELERAKAEYAEAARSINRERQQLEQRINVLLEELERAKTEYEEATRAIASEQERLEQRVKELEVSKTAQEDATREIIRESVSTLGSKINESVALGGTIEVLAGKSEDFSGESTSEIKLNTAELDLEVQVNEWTLGSMVIEYIEGTDTLFPTTEGSVSGVDRFNVDTAYITIGDPQRFPPYLTAGRIVLPFGISTGDPVADVLTIEDPLTIETFEMREDAVLLGVGFPTPPQVPPAPPISPPPVRPLVINPLFRSIKSSLGYAPPPARVMPSYLTPAPAPPPFNAGIYVFNGDTGSGDNSGGMSTDNHYGGTVGFRTRGNCGRPYEQRGADGRRWLEFPCPWSVDLDIDYNSSVFDSQFLGSEYQSFLGQIGLVSGMAASVKANLGPVALVGEWNGATKNATFLDGLGNPVRIRPAAWQVSLGYQFDWNPWVEEIGAQGTYLALGYSESSDLAGVTRLNDGESERVGFVPRKRYLVSAGEWVLDGVRVAVEYSHNVDYPRNQGGTGKSANGIFSMLTYVW